MKVWAMVLVCYSLLAADSTAADQNNTDTTQRIMTKFQKRAGVIKKMNEAKEAEAKQLEEDGFCSCSVQRP